MVPANSIRRSLLHQKYIFMFVPIFYPCQIGKVSFAIRNGHDLVLSKFKAGALLYKVDSHLMRDICSSTSWKLLLLIFSTNSTLFTFYFQRFWYQLLFLKWPLRSHFWWHLCWFLVAPLRVLLLKLKNMFL